MAFWYNMLRSKEFHLKIKAKLKHGYIGKNYIVAVFFMSSYYIKRIIGVSEWTSSIQEYTSLSCVITLTQTILLNYSMNNTPIKWSITIFSTYNMIVDNKIIEHV